MKKILLAMMAMAAALSASAATIELLKNGEGTTLDGWVNTDSRPSASFTNQTTEGGISWFASSFRQCQLSQTVTLLERGLTKGDIQGKPTVTASGIVWAGQNNGSNSGNNICNVKVYELDASGKQLWEHVIMDRTGELISSPTSFSNAFRLDSGTRKLKFELNGKDSVNWEGFYGPKFRNCSLSVEKTSTVLADGDIYTVASNETLEGENGISPINVAAGARAVINIKNGATLTVKGQDASGTSAGTAAIYLTPSSTLYIVGDGTLIATGGNAANGENTSNGGNAEYDDTGNDRHRNGAGGAGGGGGGGAAAGIGGSGGAGGGGGSGAAQADWRYSDRSEHFPADGSSGEAGTDGTAGVSCGSVYILGDVTVSVSGGAAGTAGRSNWVYGINTSELAFYGWHAGGGGPGGAGGGGGAAMSIGGGGGGGAGGGGGGSGSYVVVRDSSSYHSTSIDGGAGGNGGGGTVGGGGTKSGGEASDEHSNYDYPEHETSSSGAGGAGGNGGTQGAGGSLYALPSAVLTLSPAREAAQPTAQTSGDAVAASITVTFMSDETTVGTEQATLMFAPPAAPGPAAKDGYLFIGYYTAATGGTQIYDAGCNPVYPVWQTVEDTTLYARWAQAYSLTFVSEGGTVGMGDYAEGGTANAPIPQRAGDYVFLGYFTENGVQVFDASGTLVPGALSGLTPKATLRAHWQRPAGSVARLVYRGQLTKLGKDEPPASDGGYTKTMHFRVYDDESAETPVWKADNQTVNVNKDGSFVATFGDDTLAELIATGSVTHVGVAIGSSAIELKPRRALRPVAAVNRALVAEGAGKDPRIGNLVTENALAANNVTISLLEVAGTVTAPGAGPVDVSPVVVGERETLTLLRGDGVNVFSKNRIDLGETANVLRGQKIGSRAAPSDGIALITSSKTGLRGLRIPGVIQYCREGEWVRAPASEPEGVKVTFFPFVGK